MKNIFETPRSRGTICAGAINTQSEASYLYVNEVFSRPKFMVLDVGRHHPQGRAHRFGDVDIPHVHLAALSSQQMVFETPEGDQTMTHVPQGSTPTTVCKSDIHTALARHQITDNALSTARWHLHHGRPQQALGRLLSAARQLKQVCEVSHA